MKKFYVFVVKFISYLFIVISFFSTTLSFSDTITFGYTGAVQNWTIPSGITTITVTAYGGSGGAGANGSTVNGASGGKGAGVTATTSVTAGNSLYLYVGGKGANASSYTGGTGGWGGSSISSGGNGGSHTTSNSGLGAGGGGGATVISTSNSLSNALIVAAGGGGGGGGASSFIADVSGPGGAGGGTSSTAGVTNGASGSTTSGFYTEAGGGGGGSSSEGSGGTATNFGGGNLLSGSAGSGGVGGAGSNNTTSYAGGASGGGGGGYKGGGGGGESAAASGGGGGGGSSFVISGSTSVTQTQGHSSATGDGSITITYFISRLGYPVRITANSYQTILEVLEQINTNQSNTGLTSALDDVSDADLQIVSKQIEGVIIKSINNLSFKNQLTFKKAVLSALTEPSINSLTRNNYTSLSLSDLNFNQDHNQYPINYVNSFDFKSMASIFKNKDLFKFETKNSTLFFKTFADRINQDKVGTSTGYEATTGGFLLGNQKNLTEKIEQGWSLGISSNDSNFDENYGKSENNTLHAIMYQNQKYDNFILGLNLGTYISRLDLDREITQGSIQTLKSRSYNYGFSIEGDVKQTYVLKNDFKFTPSFSTSVDYIIQDDLDEKGGDLALAVKNDNLLIINPQIGFALDKNFEETDQVSKNLSFAIYESYEKKLDGTSSTAKIKNTGSNFNIVDDSKDDAFLIVGLGYKFFNKLNDTQYNFDLSYKQNDNNNLNSTLVLFNYNKKF